MCVQVRMQLVRAGSSGSNPETVWNEAAKESVGFQFPGCDWHELGIEVLRVSAITGARPSQLQRALLRGQWKGPGRRRTAPVPCYPSERSSVRTAGELWSLRHARLCGVRQASPASDGTSCKVHSPFVLTPHAPLPSHLPTTNSISSVQR